MHVDIGVQFSFSDLVLNDVISIQGLYYTRQLLSPSLLRGCSHNDSLWRHALLRLNCSLPVYCNYLFSALAVGTIARIASIVSIIMWVVSLFADKINRQCISIFHRSHFFLNHQSKVKYHTVLPANNTISAFTPSLRASPPFGWYSCAYPRRDGQAELTRGSWLDWDTFPAPGVEPRYGHPYQC